MLDVRLVVVDANHNHHNEIDPPPEGSLKIGSQMLFMLGACLAATRLGARCMPMQSAVFLQPNHSPRRLVVTCKVGPDIRLVIGDGPRLDASIAAIFGDVESWEPWPRATEPLPPCEHRIAIDD